LNTDVGETAHLLAKVLGSNASVEAKPYAAYALGDLRRPESVTAIVKAAKGGNPRVQRAAIDALGTVLEFGRADLRQAVKAMIIDELIGIMKRDPDRTVRSRAASALGRSGDALVVPALVEALKDPNLWVGSYAAHTLGRLGDAKVIPALKDYARRAERESQVDAAEQAIEMIRSRAKQE
jgi:HEAT repeat protein